MDRKSLLNQLELAYAPLTAYEFALSKDDQLLELALQEANLYILAQRPVITFENVSVDELSYSLNFEIHQKDNDIFVRGNLPLIQEAAGSKMDDTIAVAFNYLDRSIEQQPPFNNIHGFSLVKHTEERNEFLLWFSPEKLLQNWWKGNIACSMDGDYKSFLKYKVHYVGQATRQSILKRLTGHSTLQDILSLESPVTEKQLPANEIVVLPFEFQDNLQFMTWGAESATEDMKAALMGELYPDRRKVFLDAEKALIKAMTPSYNRQLFKNYPKSKDGLYDDKYDVISYTFMDPITLVYDEGTIVGGISPLGGDAILIIDNKEFKLSKMNQS